MRQSAKRGLTQGSAQNDGGENRAGALDAPRRGRAGAVGIDALNVAASALGRAGFSDSTLVLHWPAIAGAAVAAVATPTKFQEGPKGAVLTLTCDPGAAVFLQHETRALIGRVNIYLGAGRVERIRLVPASLVPPPEPPRHPRANAPSSPVAKGEGAGPALDRLGKLRKALRKKDASPPPD